MRSTEENKMSMYNAVKTVLTKFRTRWERMQGFVLAVSSFTNKLFVLETNVSLQKRIITGIALDKRDLKETLSDYSYMVAGAVHAYAQSTGNDELRKSVDFVRSDFTLMRDDIIDKECRNIYAIALEQLGNIGDYGITQEILNGLQELIEKYHAKSPEVRTAIAARVTYTEAIGTLESDIDLILEGELDKLMAQFRQPVSGGSGSSTGSTANTAAPVPAQGDFYEQYFKAREIIDLGKHTFHEKEFEVPANGSITIVNVVDHHKVKNTGHTILGVRDIGVDEPVLLHPGEEFLMITPTGKIVVQNSHDVKVIGKITVTVYKRDAFAR